MSERRICIHGHFYQPPRENPWLEAIEREESARPFHDWNERITHEAYAPNAFSRILDGSGRISRIVNNYSRISFNFGPTLLAWMERKAPEAYTAILHADRLSQERFSGHGSALAQAYSHSILPLSGPRDRRTQVLWGIRDFVHRFGRDPKGMWLPETAVDTDTLEHMAEAGIQFTILAPRQAEAVRDPGGEWRWLEGDEVDTTQPYRVSLPSGREIVVFFYNGELSRAVAFERLLSSGDQFADRLLGAGRSGHGAGTLAHIATDGETYGHHHRHGEMALSFALQRIEEEGVGLTNYMEHLEEHPPVREARIREGSSWSCAHGVERWRADCGCSTGGPTEWNQRWRAPLREALDWLRDSLEPRFEEEAGELLRDPWGARDRYVDLVLDRAPENVERFLEEEGARALSAADRTRVLKLLELQRHAMLMYTSCGWFFNDISGLESLQVLKYAARALHLSEILFSDRLEEEFKDRLASAKSNVLDQGSGRDLYERKVRTVRVGLPKVAAHHAVSTLFHNGVGEERPVYCYSVVSRDDDRMRSGRARLALGRLHVTSRITGSTNEFSYAVLHMGDHNLVGGVRPFRDPESYRSLMRKLTDEFENTRFPDVIRTLDQEFHAATYSLHSLFRDEQEWVVDRILEGSLADAEGVLTGLYESRAPLMRFLAELSISQPRPFRTAGEFVINTRLERALAADPPDLEGAEGLIAEARKNRLELDGEAMAYRMGEALHALFDRLDRDPNDRECIDALLRTTGFLELLPFSAELWWAQNHYFGTLDEVVPGFIEKASRGDEEAKRWLQAFRTIGERLAISVPDELSAAGRRLG